MQKIPFGILDMNMEGLNLKQVTTILVTLMGS